MFQSPRIAQVSFVAYAAADERLQLIIFTLGPCPAQNAGFLIPNTFRGLKIGKTLGKSYLIYGPKLGLSFRRRQPDWDD